MMSENLQNETHKYNNANEEEKIFLIFNISGLGDILLCNSLCQNIKHIFPESKIVFISDKESRDAARYQEGVDDVVVYVYYGEHKGDAGLSKFLNDFPYKNIFASIITYYDERQYAIAEQLKSQHIYMEHERLFIPVQQCHNLLLSPLTDETLINYPIKVNLPNIYNPINDILMSNEKYIVLCGLSTRESKDMPVDTIINLINMVNKYNLKTVLVGERTEKSDKYINQLKQNNISFIDMVGKTSVIQLGQIIKDSDMLISIDTGTMHFGYALGTPTVCVFYEKQTSKYWAPDKTLYNHTTVLQNPSDEEIIQEAMSLYKQFN